MVMTGISPGGFRPTATTRWFFLEARGNTDELVDILADVLIADVRIRKLQDLRLELALRQLRRIEYRW
jgi:hypothetical protein